MRVTDFTEGDYLKKRRHLLWFPLFEEETAGHVSSVAASTSSSYAPPFPLPLPVGTPCSAFVHISQILLTFSYHAIFNLAWTYQREASVT